jgi:hypothetical protein
MILQRTILFVGAALVSVLPVLGLAQEGSGGPGVVVAVDEKGMATVRIGDKEQTVALPGVKVGDKVVCLAQEPAGKWECTVHTL